MQIFRIFIVVFDIFIILRLNKDNNTLKVFIFDITDI